MKLGAHAYVWTSEWNDSQLGLVERCKNLGLDLIEIPLMRLDLCNPAAIREECERVGIGVCTSTVLDSTTDSDLRLGFRAPRRCRLPESVCQSHHRDGRQHIQRGNLF